MKIGLLQKKLVTSACAAGILACGACFLPPPHEPPPPLPPALAFVHVLGIEVEDGTASNLFDPQIMSKATAGNFNQLWKDFPIHAEAVSGGASSDAVLHIRVVRKKTDCEQKGNGRQFCFIHMTASFTVRAVDGRVLQSLADEPANFGLSMNKNGLPEVWNSNPILHEAAYALAMAAGGQILFSHRRN